MNTRIKDLLIVSATGLLCLYTAYRLINSNFTLIYGISFLIVAIAAWRLSTPWLKNAFLFFASLLFMLTVAEWVLYLNEPSEEKSDRLATLYTRGYSQPLRRNGGELGYAPYPAQAVQAWKRFGHDKIYEAVYTFDDRGFRQTPGFQVPDANEPPPVFFYGGSFAFGEGLNDDETLPYFFAAETDWGQPVVNFAFSGYGPHQMLRSLELGTPETLGITDVENVVYVAVPDHARRCAGEAWWDPVGPGYTLADDGTVSYSGRFTAVPDRFIMLYYRYLQVVKVARRSRVFDLTANLLTGANVSDPAANSALMVGIVNEVSRIVQQDLSGRFTVLFWDDETEESDLVLDGLQEKGIHVIRVSEFIPPAELPHYQIANDSHPTAEANQLLARGLVERLGYPEQVKSTTTP